MMSFWVVPVSVAAVDGGLVGDGDIEPEQPCRGRVDRHRGVHLAERDLIEQRLHVAAMDDRDADLADLAASQLRVGVIAGLRRQIEGDREPGLALGEVAAVELVGAAGVGVACVGPHHPGAIALQPVLDGARSSQGLYSPSRRGRAEGVAAPARMRRDRPIVRGDGQSDRHTAHGQRPGDRRLGERRADRRPRARLDDRDPAGGPRGTEPRAILLTHIHLDHAAATGTLCERFPELRGLRARDRAHRT